MIYKEFKDLRLSVLGMGTMRLPVKDGNYGQIDEDETAKIIEFAMKNGINYYDTAWGYHNGNSETVIGSILKNYPRESFYLATKFPGYDLSNMDKAEQIFETQLRKCQVDYFDFYLFHNVCEMNIDAYLDERYGVFEYLIKQKRNGKIRHLGFSAHGSYDTVKRFLDAYGSEIEFCQLQINYLDWTLQDAKKRYDLLSSYGIDVWVMEPLRGGKLASLGEKHEKTLRALRPDESCAAWGFRFLQSLPQVKMILSGMSSIEQLEQNIKTFSEEKPLNDNEIKALFDIAETMKSNLIPCTNCHYCEKYCTKKLNIPKLISIYNSHAFTGAKIIPVSALKNVSPEKRPDKCIACKKCEKVCPQQIKISQVMHAFAEKTKH